MTLFDHWRKKEMTGLKHIERSSVELKFGIVGVCIDHWRKKEMTELKHIERSSVRLKFGMVCVCSDHWHKKENDRTETY